MTPEMKETLDTLKSISEIIIPVVAAFITIFQIYILFRQSNILINQNIVAKESLRFSVFQKRNEMYQDLKDFQEDIRQLWTREKKDRKIDAFDVTTRIERNRFLLDRNTISVVNSYLNSATMFQTKFDDFRGYSPEGLRILPVTRDEMKNRWYELTDRLTELDKMFEVLFSPIETILKAD